MTERRSHQTSNRDPSSVGDGDRAIIVVLLMIAAGAGLYAAGTLWWS